MKRLASFLLPLLLAAGLLGMGCEPLGSLFSSEQEPRPAATADTVTVSEGARVALNAFDADLHFVEVEQDSRCPKQANCIWAGEAVIRIAFAEANQDTVGFALKLPGFTDLSSGSGYEPVDTLGYTFTLLQLDPYPQAEETPTSTRAVATIHVAPLP